jgi:DnaJ-class molecular chaperone
MSLSVEDLIGVCERCGGSGNPYKRHREGSPDYGQKTEPVSNSEMCLDCNGTGKGITESGKAILELLKLLKEQGRLRNYL